MLTRKPHPYFYCSCEDCSDDIQHPTCDHWRFRLPNLAPEMKASHGGQLWKEGTEHKRHPNDPDYRPNPWKLPDWFEDYLDSLYPEADT